MMNGFQVLERLRALVGYSLVPVIILTTSDAKVDCQRAGADGFITKPPTLDQLTNLAGKSPARLVNENGLILYGLLTFTLIGQR